MEKIFATGGIRTWDPLHSAQTGIVSIGSGVRIPPTAKIFSILKAFSKLFFAFFQILRNFSLNLDTIPSFFDNFLLKKKSN